MIPVNHKPQMHRLVRNGMFVALLISIVGLLGYLAWDNRVQWDVSQNERHSLSQASVALLKKIDGPVDITVYATAQDAELGDIRKIISGFLSRYERAKADLTVTFVDPARQPELARDAGVHVNGEMVVAFKGRREHLTIFDEQALTSLLMRLARSGDKRVMTLAGHGERKLDGAAGHDLGEFGKQLTAKGFKIATLNLAVDHDVPANASALVIASPQTDLPEGEVDKLLAYIARGGNLLWLIDQESLRGLQPLAEKLELTLTPGVVVDPQAQQLKLPITFALGANYGQHPVTDNFDYITMFPFARQITINENEAWRSISLVEAAQDGWVETGKLDSAIAFDQMYDVSGPVSIAAALSRTLQDREQRIAIIGSANFLANTYLGNGNNLDFGINLVNWLTGDENLIAIQPRATVDSSLILSESTLIMIAGGFLIVLPLVFLASGATIWWRRRRR
ncbi:MAG: GldG family protein [Nitrosospira sp.]|nr:GldG family protein [Nitrosospira sp.]